LFFPRLKILTAALLFSTGGMAVKSCQLTDWQVASFRCGLAAVVMWGLLPAARRRWSWRIVAVGAAYAGTLTLYVLANKATTAANAIFLQSTAPLYLLLLGPLVLGERTRGRDLLVMVAMAAGLMLLLGGGTEASVTAPAPMRGNILGALAGICWALTILGLRWLERVPPEGRSAAGAAVTAVVAGNVIAFLVPLPWALPVTAARPADGFWVIFLGVLQVALPYAILTSAMREVPAFEAGLLLLAEPVFNPVWAYLVHGEEPRGTALLGGALILLVTLVKSWLDFRQTTGRR
jgi:drug/metabolite transporter (DMT)-like permease